MVNVLAKPRPTMGAAIQTAWEESKHCRYRFSCLHSDNRATEAECAQVGEWWDLGAYTSHTQRLEGSLQTVCASWIRLSTCTWLNFCLFLLWRKPFFSPWTCFLTLNSKEGGLLLDRTANHFFFFLRRRGKALPNTFYCPISNVNMSPLTDLPDVEIDEGRHGRRPKHDDDGFVIVKEYISSTTMRQKPLLCALAENTPRVPLLPEGTWESFSTFSWSETFQGPNIHLSIYIFIYFFPVYLLPWN